MADYNSTGSAGMTSASAINRVFNNIASRPSTQAAIAASPTVNTSDIVNGVLQGLNINSPTSYLSAAKDLADLNTEASRAMAREQMAFQERANAKAMEFSSSEAFKDRNWQQMMSDTAHQREVKDLIAAGLNPILSVNNGASTPSGASAQGVTSAGAQGFVDTSAVDALTQAYVQARQVEMQTASLALQEKRINADIAMNALNNETNRLTADIAAKANMYSADKTSSAHRYAAELDYSTWTNGLHNQYAQLGEWIYKALTGINFKGMFNFSNLLGNLFKNEVKSSGSGYHESSPIYVYPDMVPLSGRSSRALD